MEASEFIEPLYVGVSLFNPISIFIKGKDFIGKDFVCLVLGDNIFFGHDFVLLVSQAAKQKSGAMVFGYYVKDPERYGVVEFDGDGKVVSIEEKPEKPKSNYAIAGLYFYDSRVVEIAENLTPSVRGELEITNANKRYLEYNELKVELMGRIYAWLDTGTHESIVDAINFVKAIEDRQGLKITCIEEIAYRKGCIGKEQLKAPAKPLMKSDYGEYLLRILEEERAV